MSASESYKDGDGGNICDHKTPSDSICYRCGEVNQHNTIQTFTSPEQQPASESIDGLGRKRCCAYFYDKDLCECKPAGESVKTCKHKFMSTYLDCDVCRQKELKEENRRIAELERRNAELERINRQDWNKGIERIVGLERQLKEATLDQIALNDQNGNLQRQIGVLEQQVREYDGMDEAFKTQQKRTRELEKALDDMSNQVRELREKLDNKDGGYDGQTSLYGVR